jgi:glycosyltransferase involved in cell wall biosynthesis
MIKSARRNIPTGIAHEFVIVDGGSTDGTIDWCQQQADVKLIQHGELRGAVAAFCDGAKAASGNYVMLGNDDITFEDNSIMPALVALENDESIGGIAFADNRPAPGYENFTGFKVQTMTARRNNVPVTVSYAQVGLFRRELGDLAGWWGADDPEFNGHTYGGDVYLTARLLEMGYSVIGLDACRITDHVERDTLRQRNAEIEQTAPGAYYRRFPNGPQMGRTPVKIEHRERLRIIYMPIYEGHYGKYKRGLREALARVGLVWEIDYLNDRYDLTQITQRFQPHLLLIQAHSPYDIPLAVLADARAQQPGMVVINWNGDVYEDKLTSPEMLAYLKHVDLQLTVNAGVLPTYAQNGIEAAYWQIGFEPVDYDDLPRTLTHDVVFLANAYSTERQELGQILRSMPGVDVGLYGRNWKYGHGDTTYQFAMSAALCRNAKIVIGDNQYGKRGFVSNRIFETLASGGFLLHQRVDGLEDLTGLQDGVHYIAWTDSNDLVQKVRYWLGKSRDAQRRKIASAGRDFVHEHHSFDMRVKELLLGILPKMEGERV